MFGLKLAAIGQSLLDIILPPSLTRRGIVNTGLDGLLDVLGAIAHFAICVQIFHIVYGWYRDVTIRRSIERLRRAPAAIPSLIQTCRRPRFTRVVIADDVVDAIQFHQPSATVSGMMHVLPPGSHPPRSILGMSGPKMYLNGRVEAWADGKTGLGLVRL
ncbi:hypothetical protein TWF694_000848 [Orbilia ellipsospora]|uniref:Uncharacterized protein n=1 Tax=Orbilia ellipsospora TaxID=2528407 RepID=A0AAV9XQA1_9PEZI